MPTPKIAITMEVHLLEALDACVREGVHPNRSKAIQEAVRQMLRRWKRKRLRAALALLDPGEEQRIADEFWGEGLP